VFAVTVNWTEFSAVIVCVLFVDVTYTKHYTILADR
jgi:hypothetical protein